MAIFIEDTNAGRGATGGRQEGGGRQTIKLRIKREMIGVIIIQMR